MPPADSGIGWEALAPGPGVLLHSASFYGTLAATRALGRAGVAVSLASTSRLPVTTWSRYARRTLRCPPIGRAAEYLAWLLALGAREPGLALVPTSDEHAWLFSLHQAELKAGFRSRSPPPGTILRLLDKRRLAEACAEVGVATLPSWYPQSEEELRALAPSLEYPLVVKPRTQLFHRTHVKGTVSDQDALLPSWRRFDLDGCADPELLSREPGLHHPILQKFAQAPEVGVVSVGGYIDDSGDLLAARCSRKVPLDPRRLEVGRWFEAMPLEQALADDVQRLCRFVGFSGVFEAEFLPFQGRMALIDFNPRLYGQLGFDEARGARLSQLAYLHAHGEVALLRRLAGAARGDSGPRLYVHRSALWVERTLGRIPAGLDSFARAGGVSGSPTGSPTGSPPGSPTGSPSAGGLLAPPAGADFVRDPDDPLPAAADLINLAAGHLRRRLGRLLRKGRSKPRPG